MSRPVTTQPGGVSGLYPFTNKWQNKLLASFKPCPRSAFSCFCNPCHTAILTRRTGDHLLTCCLNPCSLMAVRTKVRTAYQIDGTLIGDCCATSCCLRACATMQLEKELDYQGVPSKPVDNK